MSTLADRLRDIVRRGADVRRGGPSGSAEASVDSPERDGRTRSVETGVDETAGLLGGEWVDTAGHRFLVIERTYRPGHRHGRLALIDHVLPDAGHWRDVLLGRAAESPAAGSDRRALFIDLETTGLAGGAGSYAFLIGCGWFEGVTFRIRQLFLASYPGEPALLESLAGLARESDLVVSYNGKTFDLPLIDTRFVMNRMQAPFASLPHVDMLHHARRLWRSEDENGGDGGCRLAEIERMVCGHEREGDVPGFEIPARYFHFVRTGDPRPLAGVLEHNRLDILSLAFLTARAAQLVEDGPPALTCAREAVGLGRLYERAGMVAHARGCFARAAGLDGHAALPSTTQARADALRAYALLCRRVRQYRDAAPAWQRLVELPGCPPHVLREAIEALAVHHEHRLRDPRGARTLALRSMPLQGTSARREALQHRLSRLERKLEGANGAALF